MRRQRNERGAVGGIEGLVFGILIFVFGLFMVMNTWAVIDGTMTASAAAREAARAYVEADTQSQAADQASDAAQEAVSGHNHDAVMVSVEPSDSYQRCEPVTATVTVVVPRVSLPLIGGTGGEVRVRSSHTEVIDPYRSNLAGTARCTN